jgi:uncharacterized membrane protein
MLLLIILLAFASTLLGASGALLLKKAGSNFTLNPFQLIKNHFLIGGLALYVIASIIFVYALKFGELSMIYPLTSLSYIWVAILSKKILGERMTRLKLMGMFFIILGVVLITIK